MKDSACVIRQLEVKKKKLHIILHRIYSLHTVYLMLSPSSQKFEILEAVKIFRYST